MSKKKTKKIEETSTLDGENVTEVLEEVAEEAVEEVAEEAPQASVQPIYAEQLFKVEEIARRCCEGFKEHWIPSIKSHARTVGALDEQTEDAWKSFLRHWGYRGAWLQ